MSKELFLSYGREKEVVAFVTQLKHDLESKGFSVWLDTEDIPAGCDWHAAIGTGLDQCKALVAVISNKYITSRYCMSELYTANGDQKHIFPVVVENVDFSSTERARGVKYVVSGINWTMFRSGYDDYHASLEKLVHGMREQGLGRAMPTAATDMTDSGVDTMAGTMSHLHLSPSGPPNSTPSPTAPPLPTSPANPGYQVTPPMYNAPPHHPPSSPYQYQHPYAGYPPPSPHTQPPIGSTPYPPYYTSPPGGYAPPVPYPPGQPSPQGGYAPPMPYQPGQPFPGSPYNTHYQPPPGPVVTSVLMTPPQTYPYHPVSPVGGPPQHGSPGGITHDNPPQYGALFPGSVSGGVSGDKVDLGDSQTVSSTPQTAVAPSKSNFKVGMKLEAVDRRFPYFVCVATVMDRNNDEVMVHFDGWGPEYNYWSPRDSVELHPSGWCLKHKWDLQQPLNQEWEGWSTYLSKTQSDAANEELFTVNQQAAPGSHLFKPEMRLEAKDRMNPSIICVATIKDVREGKVLIHFDSWGNEYDYWCETGSTDLHPAMWCGKNGQQIQPPRGYKGHFKWSEYLANSKVNPAPAHLFSEEQLSGDGRRKTVKPSNASLGGFQVGMKLEARDRLHASLVCVATISDIKDDQLLIHFDGWSSKYDYWCKPSSQDIHPKGWSSSSGRDIQPPNGFIGSFNWNSYLSSTSSTAAPDHLFTEKQKPTVRPPAKVEKFKVDVKVDNQFRVGMKLEAKDRLNPSLVCVSTITDIRNNELLIHFDGWTNKYDYWCRPDTTDIHPRGWCETHGKTLQAPKGHGGPFNWSAYLAREAAVAAPDKLFSQSSEPIVTATNLGQFRVGMKLEAKDRLNPSLVCVATITAIRNNQLVIHFDGWTDAYDYLCEPHTPDIHPIGWCRAHGVVLQSPLGYSSVFNWNNYLHETGSEAVPRSVFSPGQI